MSTASLSPSASPSAPASKTLAEELDFITKRSVEMVEQKFNAEEKSIYLGFFEELQTSHIKDSSKKVGEKAPHFELVDYITGQTVSLSSLIASGPLVLFFYRGVWCPFCSIQIRHFQKSLSAFQSAYKGGAAAGKVTVAGVSLQVKSQVEKAKNDVGVSFPLLTDESLEVSSSYGLLWHVPDKYEQVVRAKFGGDLTKSQHNLSASAVSGTKLLVNKIGSAAVSEREGLQIVLPAPATFVIDSSGIIRFAQVNPDYRQRADPSDVINALKAL